jgi:4-hydroxybenzoate polyprenyltransferase
MIQLLRAFFKLIRWPNLVFIALTQCLFYTQIGNKFATYDFEFIFRAAQLPFILLVIASLLIAAGGYIINDYFDLHIDGVNKPQSLVIDKIIKRRWGIFMHLLFEIFLRLNLFGIIMIACLFIFVKSDIINIFL